MQVQTVAIAFPEMGGLKAEMSIEEQRDDSSVAIAFPEMGGLKVHAL